MESHASHLIYATIPNKCDETVTNSSRFCHACLIEGQVRRLPTRRVKRNLPLAQVELELREKNLKVERLGQVIACTRVTEFLNLFA